MSKGLSATKLFLIPLVFLHLFLISPASAGQGTIMAETNARLSYIATTNNLYLYGGGSMISTGTGWEVKEAGPGLFHVRRSSGDPGVFFEIDLGAKAFYGIRGGRFGEKTDKMKATPTAITLESEYMPGKPVQRIDISIEHSLLTFDTDNGQLDILVAGQSITSADEWESAEPREGIYQIRHSTWKGFFWEIDTRQRMAAYVSNSKFGTLGLPGSSMQMEIISTGGGLAASSGGKKASKGAPPANAEGGILPDYDFESGAPTRVSDWTESEKRLYGSILIKDAYDVLVTPFQVQGYAFDRANRSLMTRYLANAIESRTGLKLPDPTVVEKSLGHGARRLSDDDIFRIADQVKAKAVIRGFVGHNLDEKMFLTILVQVRGSDGRLGSIAPVTRLEWKGIPFSDTNPPAEAFKALLEDIMSRLPLKSNGTPKTSRFAKTKTPVPQGIATVVEGVHSRLDNAVHLQIMGMLYPEDNSSGYVDDFYEREPLFEKSLIALEGVSPDSTDYRLLKARAWFYLGSRPAALKAIGTAVTPAEKAFKGFLDGSIPEMERWVGEIDSPADRLMARIQLNDLKLDYGRDLYDREAVREIVIANKGLEILLARRLTGKDLWDHLPNLAIKKLMDDSFPIKGFDVKTMLMGRLASREDQADDYEADLSVYKHRSRYVEANPEGLLLPGAAARPTPLDHLDLLYQAGEGNLWKKVRLRVMTQGLYDKGKALLDAYEPVYKGHLKHMYLKQITLGILLGINPQNRVYDLERDELKEKVCYYAQGQLGMAWDTCFGHIRYIRDYPGRWKMTRTSSRRSNLKTSIEEDLPRHFLDFELDLAYTHNQFACLADYYKELEKRGMAKKADELLKLNERRFDGTPKKVKFLASKAEAAGDYDKVVSIYEKAIADTPSIWDYYDSLGGLYLGRGEGKKARAIYDGSPYLNEGNGEVDFSKRAFSAGYNFLVRGMLEDAKPFLKKSAGNGTGAGSEMWSAGYLAILEGDLAGSAPHFLETWRRYNDARGLDRYMAILHLLGRHEDAMAAYNSANLVDRSSEALLLGFRMEGLSQEEQTRRLNEETAYRLREATAYNFAILRMTDRAPNEKTFAEYVMLNARSRGIFPALDAFGLGYHDVKSGLFIPAYGRLKGFWDRQKGGFRTEHLKNYSYLIPYYSYASAKTGKTAEAEQFLKEAEREIGERFDYHLSMAFIHGVAGRHVEAKKSIEAARSNITGLFTQPLPQWYRLVEACEWLYKDSSDKGYIDLALGFSKTSQRLLTFWGWAYAVEAKYSDPGPARTKALAMALYLDKNSERISGISEKEKAAALKWLEKNNPFLKKPRLKGGA